MVEIPGYPFQAGDRIDHEVLNTIIETMVANGLAVIPGVPHVRTRGGVVLKPATSSGLIQFQTPPGGIPARFSLAQSAADCYVVTEDAAGNLTVTTQTVEVWNYSGGTIGGNKFGVAGPVNGKLKALSMEC